MHYFNFNIESKERYDPAKFMAEKEDMLDILDSYFMIALSDLPAIGTYIVTYEVYRPDLVSYSIYKDVNYWWILLFYNNLTSYCDIKTGLVIKYPSIEAIEDLYFQLKAKELKGAL